MFDKTGTLTCGKPTVTKAILYVPKKTCSFKFFTTIAGIAERNSEHPLGAAIKNFAELVSIAPFTNVAFCSHSMKEYDQLANPYS